MAIPDEFIIWSSYAIFKCINIINKENIEIVYSTAPPFSNHILSVLLKKLTKKPLVTDFRDAWIANPVREWQYPKVRRAVESLLEKIVIRSSDRVISTTEGITQDFRCRYPLESANKFITIPNGYDREEVALPKQDKRTDTHKMRIVHTGYLKMERSPKFFLEALRLLFDERPEIEAEMEVYFIGENSEFIDGKKIGDYIKQYKLQRVVILTGHVPRIEAAYHQTQSDILLLIIGVVPKDQVFTYGIASKVFDYMIAGKPVLALADTGPVSELIENTGIGCVLEPSDVKGIKEYLSNAFDMYKENRLNVSADMIEIAKYDVQLLTKKLAELFGTCTQDTSRGGEFYPPATS
jgi:glycosyltransferase involved in cell wall biosynthesis